MNYKETTLLEIVEALAYFEDMPESEEDVSKMFDEEIGQSVADEYGCDDEIAFSEAFSNWMDAKVESGEIHELQYEAYDYVGRWS